jgi:hypothetical protein
LRAALVASVSALFVLSLVGAADAAPRKSKRYHEDAAAASGKKKAPPKLPFGELPKGPLQIVVSTGAQHATLYANGVRIEQTRVSTGTPQKPTPHGVFSIIEKDRYHHSNLYGNAPMYYMHRLTWSGVAMHEGMLPGFAASHGCIRMPTGFVSRLWQISKLGIRVVVARNDPEPREFSHAKLFNPAQKPAEKVSELAPIDDLRPTITANEAAIDQTPRLMTVAQASATVADDSGKIPETAAETPSAIEQAPPPALVTPVESEIETTATTPAAAAPVVAAPAVSVAVPTQVAETPAAEPEKRAPDGAEPVKPLPPRGRNTNEPVKRSGQIAVFISKKEKKIFVRQGFVPVFDMPVEIANPEIPLGTHVFTALEVRDEGAHMRWNAISMPTEQARTVEHERGKRGRKSEPPPRSTEGKPPSTAAEALDRVTIPQAAIDRISEMLIPGSSLVISDYGLGNETGRMTEFIVVTR